MNNTSVFGSSFSPDESKIIFSSNEFGIYNAYEIGIEEGVATQLTKREESTYTVGYFPNDERILISSDKGGNEINHLYVRETDESIKDIIPYENARASFTGWSQDLKSFFIQMNNRDPKFMDLYEVDIETLEPTLIFENNDGYFVGPISANKNLVALTKPVTRSYSMMFLFNREKNELTKLKDIEETVFNPLEFSLDNKSLYYLTDENSEFTYL